MGNLLPACFSIATILRPGITIKRRICQKWHLIIPKTRCQIAVVLLLSLALFLRVWQIIPDPVTRFKLILPNTITNFSNYRTDSLNSSDYTQLMDLHDFSFTILNTPCNASYTLVIVLVHSAPGNFKKRQTIRETWGQRMVGLKLLFMLGLVKDNHTVKSLVKENDKYADLVQGTFLDSYRNMTYKHAMVFKYALYHCPQANYLLKTDDDVFINTYSLLDFLKNELPEDTGNLLICKQAGTAPAQRSNSSKWRVSFEEYRNEYYPPYCLGFSLLYSKDVVFRLYKELQTVNYFWIDDVLITGIIFKKLNMRHIKHNNIALSPANQKEILDNKKRVSWKDFLYGKYDSKESDIRKLWNIVTKNFNSSTLIQSSS